jgi:glutamate racemase
MMLSPPLNHALGVFDSGVGGLTVLEALRRRLPNRDFVYFGDTARVPYGRKPPAMVERFALEIGDFLGEMGVDGIVVACNTASAVALPSLTQSSSVPVWGVIDPGVDAATRATRSGRVAVVGTKGTIASGAYQRRLESRGLQVWAQACPMLVHVAEEGLADSPEAELLVRHYLQDMPEVDTLILGCTHYPLLRHAFANVLGPGVTLVDSAETVAEAVSLQMVNGNATAPGRVSHLVTGDPAAFAHTARLMGAREEELVRVDRALLGNTMSTAPGRPRLGDEPSPGPQQ